MNDVKILYVDDEKENLNSFKAGFRRNYQVSTALSAEEAIEVLSREAIHVIISDQRMPKTSGVELFKQIKDLYPDPVRILLTGYSDINILADAVNQGHIFRYLTKPWSELELETCISNAYDYYLAKTELKTKIGELQKANDNLNRFIYSISHELRAPVASALGIINLTKLEGLFETKSSCSEYWHMMEECCIRLDRNLSSMLHYYKANRQMITTEEIDFKSLVEKLISLHKTALQVSNEIRVTINVAQPVKFVGDAFRIEIILSNFISNALKYQNPEENNKTVAIAVTVNEEQAIIRIRDNGVGILPEDKKNIFEQFYRNNNQQGIGLGLFIANEALSKLSGTILLESEINKGSTFTINIPNQYKKETLSM